MRSPLRHLALLAVAMAAVGCDFQPETPEGPPALAPSRSAATVKVEYRQPNGCLNQGIHCNDLVVFFGSWMHPGEEIYLAAVPGSHVWSGVASNVPVNWPPVDEPHLVRVFDPHLVESPTGGVTGARLAVGGQVLTQYDSPGTPQESALVYVDDDGVGRNPF